MIVIRPACPGLLANEHGSEFPDLKGAPPDCKTRLMELILQPRMATPKGDRAARGQAEQADWAAGMRSVAARGGGNTGNREARDRQGVPKGYISKAPMDSRGQYRTSVLCGTMGCNELQSNA